MTKICICQICNCGRHHCPHKPHRMIGQGSGPCNLTEYAQKYREQPLTMRQSFKPSYEPTKNGDPIEDKTTNRMDYVPHPLEKPFHKGGDPYKKPQGHMDGTTSYTKDYTLKHGDRARPAKREYTHKVAGDFEGEPTYKSDYRKWPMEARARFTGEKLYEPNREPFAGESSYHTDYVKRNTDRTRSFKPNDVAQSSGEPIDDRTGYRDAYVKHALPEKFRRETDRYMGPKAPLDGMTTFQRDFTEKPMERGKSFKPDASGFSSGAPFDGHTTHQNDFKEWDVPRPHIHEQDQWVKPAGNMEMNSTSHLAFTKHPLQRVQQKRPTSQQKAYGDFDGTTTNKTDFIKWPMNRSLPTIRQDTHMTPGRFEGDSTYKSHYVGHRGDPTRSFKPDSHGFQSDAPFDDGTMYRTEFVPKKTAPCPAAILDGDTSRFVYKEQDSRGHKFYQPVSEQVYDMQNGNQRIPMPVS